MVSLSVRACRVCITHMQTFVVVQLKAAWPFVHITQSSSLGVDRTWAMEALETRRRAYVFVRQNNESERPALFARVLRTPHHCPVQKAFEEIEARQVDPEPPTVHTVRSANI